MVEPAPSQCTRQAACRVGASRACERERAPVRDVGGGVGAVGPPLLPPQAATAATSIGMARANRRRMPRIYVALLAGVLSGDVRGESGFVCRWRQGWPAGQVRSARRHGVGKADGAVQGAGLDSSPGSTARIYETVTSAGATSRGGTRIGIVTPYVGRSSHPES